MFSKIIAPDAELQLLNHTHHEAITALVDANRERLRRWFFWAEKNTAESTKTFIESSLQQFARDDGFQAVIVWKGKPAGVAGFHGFNWQNKSTSMGYWLGAEAEGKGLMTAAVRAMVDYALVERGLNRVEIRAGVENARSRAVAQRLGFVEEGVLRQAEWLYDHFQDLVVYAMLGGDWIKAQ